tara:strand:- start:92 stop:334 length:243 start_codon:yes stop_codon:yes gene_type:complete
MKSRIIEICELGQPQSIIHRENEPITELIKTDSLIEELNKQLLLYNVVQQSEQYCECEKPTLGKSFSKCGTCDEWFKPLK